MPGSGSSRRRTTRSSPVQAGGDAWTLTAPFDGEPLVHPEPMPAAEVATLLGPGTSELAGDPLWVDTGMEQLLVPLRTPEAVRKASPAPGAIGAWPRSRSGRSNAYLFAFSGETRAGRRAASARFFIKARGSGLYEDPGTGSASANLGGWLLHTRRAPACKVRVGGRVMEVARGELMLP